MSYNYGIEWPNTDKSQIWISPFPDLKVTVNEIRVQLLININYMLTGPLALII